MNSKPSWELKIDPAVFKTLKKIPFDYAKKITRLIQDLPKNPYAGDIQKIKDEDQVWRRRFGDYRIFFELNSGNHLVNVFRVERRTSKTY